MSKQPVCFYDITVHKQAHHYVTVKPSYQNAREQGQFTAISPLQLKPLCQPLSLVYRV